MKISCGWLKEFVDLDSLKTSPSDWAGVLTMLGLPVEGVEEIHDDVVFDIEVTTNRPDCLNHLGVARELAAHYGLALQKPDFSEPQSDEAGEDPEAEVEIHHEELCRRYAARVLSHIQVDESPPWLRSRLESIGQRTVNNIVDITNYVLFSVGHPLHAFDLEKLQDRRIVVRRARDGEKLTTLDGVTRNLNSAILAICDSRVPVAIGGVMGGEETEVSNSTHTILLESAYFEPGSVRQTSKQLGLRTEASYRFERGADPEMPVCALNFASRLIMELAGGRCQGPVIDRYPNRQERQSVSLRPSRIGQITGIEIDHDEAAELLKRLEFQTQDSESQELKVQVPGFRVDVGIEEDLVEEVVRHVGYDKLPAEYPAPASPGQFSPTDQQERLLFQVLTGYGFSEVINYSFGTPDREELFIDGSSMIPLANPLSDVDSHLRTSLVPGIVETLRRNFNYGAQDVRLFETGSVFRSGGSPDLGDHIEEPHLVLAAAGEMYNPYWSQQASEFLFPHLKGVLEGLFQAFQRQAHFERAPETRFLHSGVSAQIFLDGEPVGLAGELHPDLKESFKFTQKIFLSEVRLKPLFDRGLPEPTYVSVIKYPPVELDLSFLVDNRIHFSKMRSAVEALEIPELVTFQLIDFYQGPNLPPGKVSLTVRLKFADASRTLTQEEAQVLSQKVFQKLEREFSVEFRT